MTDPTPSRTSVLQRQISAGWYLVAAGLVIFGVATAGLIWLWAEMTTDRASFEGRDYGGVTTWLAVLQAMTAQAAGLAVAGIGMLLNRR